MIIFRSPFTQNIYVYCVKRVTIVELLCMERLDHMPGHNDEGDFKRTIDVIMRHQHTHQLPVYVGNWGTISHIYTN